MVVWKLRSYPIPSTLSDDEAGALETGYQRRFHSLSLNTHPPHSTAHHLID